MNVDSPKTINLSWGWGNRLNMIMFWHRHPDVHFKWDIADKKEGEMVNTLTSTFEEYIDFSDCNISISLDVQGSLLRQKEESLIPPTEIGSPWHRQKYVRGLIAQMIDQINAKEKEFKKKGLKGGGFGKQFAKQKIKF